MGDTEDRDTYARTAGATFSARTSTDRNDGVGWKGRENPREEAHECIYNATGPTNTRHQIPSRDGVVFNGSIVEDGIIPRGDGR